MRPDGLAHVETVQHDRGTGWVVPRLVELVGKHEAAKVFCDAAGPAGALIPDLEKKKIEVEALTAQDYARACGGFFDGVEQRTAAPSGHAGDPVRDQGRSDEAARGRVGVVAENSGVDITPLVAATLALWGTVTAKAPRSAWGPAEVVYG
jgi:hypothetical protein